MPDHNNPYTKDVGFVEDAQEDIIRITQRPLEAAFDAEGDEVIQLHEQEQEVYREDNAVERIVIKPEEGGLFTIEDILADAGIELPEEEPDPHA